MAANTSVILSNLDFDTLKNTFKQHLKSQSRFRDYDFDGSNINVLLDILTYNTHLNAFYLNMVGNEMFLDSAQIRDSVVSHAKELNYTPRSFKAATADIGITVTSTDLTKRSILIPKGTTFTSRLGPKNFTFNTIENVVLNDIAVSNGTASFSGEITVYEGNYATDTFTVNGDTSTRYVLSNQNADISTISVTVIEDMGATVLTYQRSISLFDITADSKVFFVQGAPNHSYEIVFGDGVSGRKPKNNSIVVVEYLTCNGELPNGCSVFKNDGIIDGEESVTIATINKAGSGSISESIDSIKFNAPRHFATQERAITTEDYETLLKLNFPEINAVSAYGGEELNPPQYGKVFVSVDLNDVDGLPTVKKDQYFKFLKPRSPVSIDPVFVDPDYMYVYVQSIIKYNINTTKLNPDDIKTLVVSSMLNYADTNLNDFNSTMRYSKLLNSIDNSHPSLISNETIVKALRVLTPTLGRTQNIDVDFGISLIPISGFEDDNINAAHSSNNSVRSIESSTFILDGQDVYIEDDGNGVVNIVTTAGGGHTTLKEVGTVDYDIGLVQLINFKVDSYKSGDSTLNIYGSPKSKDIYSQKNTILNIRESDISITIEQIRE